MARSFNTTGPCIPGEHYLLPPEQRCPGLMDLIEQKHFFVLHAPRQSGKTTLLKSVARTLNAGTKYHALYCSLETVQGFDEPQTGVPAILRQVGAAIEFHPALGREDFGALAPKEDISGGLRVGLSRLCRKLDRRLVVLFDEADALRVMHRPMAR